MFSSQFYVSLGSKCQGQGYLLWVFQINEIVCRCVNVRLHVAKPDV